MKNGLQTPIQQRMKLASSLEAQVRLRELSVSLSVSVDSIESQQQAIDELIALEEVKL